MNDFIEKAMLFINENTLLLIGICIFLIIVLIGYLIDNAIKTRKLEMEEMNYLKESEPVTDEQESAPVTTVEETKVETITKAPVIGTTATAPVEEVAIETEPVIEEKEETTVEENVEVTPVVIPELSEEVAVSEPATEATPDLNELLARIDKQIAELDAKQKELDAKNETKEVEAPVIEKEVTVTEPVSDVIDTKGIEELLNKDFSKNIEIVNSIDEKVEMPIEPVKVNEELKQEKTYKNDKKLSDIFGKKKTETKELNLETTKDFTDELDRILDKLNTETPEVSTSYDSDEFNNRF